MRNSVGMRGIRAAGLFLVPLVGLALSSATADEKRPIGDGDRAPAHGTSTPGTQTDASQQSKFEDLGVDLVITKVRVTRGDWAQGRYQIVPYVKNMCNDKVSQPIKVGFPSYHAAIWLRSGLGPKQEKSAGAYYRNGGRDGSLGAFEVIVDPDNGIREENDSNNSTTVPALPRGVSSRTYAARVTGVRCRRAPDIKKYQMGTKPTR